MGTCIISAVVHAVGIFTNSTFVSLVSLLFVCGVTKYFFLILSLTLRNTQQQVKPCRYSFKRPSFRLPKSSVFPHSKSM
jgi:hypothetical protein